MKFDWKAGLVWVEIEILYGGQAIPIDNCIVDTGSVSTALDIDLINFDYQQPASIHRLIGVGGGTQEVLSQKVDEIRLDQQIIKDIDIEFGDLDKELGINGFIGTNVLSKFVLKMDFKTQTLDLSVPRL